MASSMKVAGRKMVESILIPGRPGSSSAERRLHPPGHIEGVGPGQLLNDEHEARSVVDHGVAGELLMVPDQVDHVSQPKDGRLPRSGSEPVPGPRP